MFFIIILGLSAFSIAAVAAYFSIYGLAAIFSGVFIPVVVMGIVLEVGKLVGASYLYQFRDSISALFRLYLFIAVLMLMTITSAGIFGFLSMGHQQDVLTLNQMVNEIELLSSEKVELQSLKQERLDRKKQIDADIAALPSNYISGRQKLMTTYGPELESLSVDISSYTDQLREASLRINELKANKLQEEAHVGPILFIADAFGVSVSNATKWLIFAIIFAFDPLAVILTLGMNNAIAARRKTKGVVPIVDESTSLKEMREALDELSETELSPEDIMQQNMLREMIARKTIVEKTRNPDS